MNIIETLIEQVSGLPAPQPIAAKAQDFRNLSDALEQHAQTLTAAHATALSGNSSPAMDAAGARTDQLTQTHTALASQARAHADALDLLAGVLAVLVAWGTARLAWIIATAFFDPPAAAIQAAAGSAAMRGAEKSLLKRFAEMFGKNEESGAVRMEMAKKEEKEPSKPWWEDGTKQDKKDLDKPIQRQCTKCGSWHCLCPDGPTY